VFQKTLLPPSSAWKALQNTGILLQHYTALQLEDGGSMVLQNVGILPQHYIASQTRRPQFEFSSPWRHQIPDDLTTHYINVATNKFWEEHSFTCCQLYTNASRSYKLIIIQFSDPLFVHNFHNNSQLDII